MSSATFRKAMNWLGILALAHIAAMIFFNFFLSGSVAEISVNDPLRANLTFFAFNFVFDIIFAFIYFKIKTSYVEYQKSFRELLRSDDYSFSKYFKEYILKEQKIMTVVFLLFQIPFTDVAFFCIPEHLDLFIDIRDVSYEFEHILFDLMFVQNPELVQRASEYELWKISVDQGWVSSDTPFYE